MGGQSISWEWRSDRSGGLVGGSCRSRNRLNGNKQVSLHHPAGRFGLQKNWPIAEPAIFFKNSCGYGSKRKHLTTTSFDLSFLLPLSCFGTLFGPIAIYNRLSPTQLSKHVQKDLGNPFRNPFKTVAKKFAWLRFKSCKPAAGHLLSLEKSRVFHGLKSPSRREHRHSERKIFFI